MYVEMAREWFAALFDRVWRRGLMRSGMVTGLVLVLLVLGLGVAYRERGRGNLHKLKAKIETERQEAAVPLPGGQEAITLLRAREEGGSSPEFLSATMLPGRGMNMLQITAYLPGRGEVKLLASPSIEDADRAMNGKGGDAAGRESLAMGGAIEAPWAGGIWGAAGQTAGHVTTVWRGHSMTLPAASGSAVARGGLMLEEPANSAGTTAMPDGGKAQAVFDAGDFGAHWPSNTELTVTVLLISRTIELTVMARNTGDVAEPIGIGWRPRFAVLDGQRQQMRLRIPGEMRQEVRDRAKGPPSGAQVPVAGTEYDFTMRGGAALGRMDFDESFTSLHQELLESGPVAELIDPANDFGLRLTALTPTIKTMRVVAPANGDFVSIDPQFNYDDPLGREWDKDEDTGMVVLQPGQTTEWKVRLEIYSISQTQGGN
jgi:galactose mutarotase-like enzyme